MRDQEMRISPICKRSFHVHLVQHTLRFSKRHFSGWLLCREAYVRRLLRRRMARQLSRDTAAVDRLHELRYGPSVIALEPSRFHNLRGALQPRCRRGNCATRGYGGGKS